MDEIEKNKVLESIKAFLESIREERDLKRKQIKISRTLVKLGRYFIVFFFMSFVLFIISAFVKAFYPALNGLNTNVPIITAFGFLISALILGFLSDFFEKRKVLPALTLQISTIQDCKDLLIKYRNNPQLKYLFEAKRCINFYYSKTDFSNIEIRNIDRIKQKNFWFVLSENTSDSVEAIGNFKSKLIPRIEKYDEIEKVIEVLDNVMCYEYFDMVIKEQKQLQYQQQSTINLRFKFFKNYIDSVNNLDVFTLAETSLVSKVSFRQKLSERTNAYFNSSNVLTSFLCWLSLFVALIYISFVSAIKFCSLEIDSNILVAIISAPLVLATTMAASNRKNDSSPK